MIIAVPFRRKLSAIPEKPAKVLPFGPRERDIIQLPTNPNAFSPFKVGMQVKPTKCCIGHGQSGHKLQQHFLACRPLCGRCQSRHRAFLRDQKAGRK